MRERKLGFDTHFVLELGSEEEEGEVTTSIILMISICSSLTLSLLFIVIYLFTPLNALLKIF